jgi:hypothetical protein
MSLLQTIVRHSRVHVKIVTVLLVRNLHIVMLLIIKLSITFISLIFHNISVSCYEIMNNLGTC